MANPADPGNFDIWITDRITFATVPGESGDTGDFEKWITDRIYWLDYVETTAVEAEVRIPRNPAAIYQTPAIF
jgi:hypothetical protein